MKKITFILLMLAVVTTAFGGPLALDDFNSYTPGNLLSQPSWSELFSSDDPAVNATEAFPGMGNSVVGLREGQYASAKYGLSSGVIDVTQQEVFITGLIKCEQISNPPTDDGLYMGLANSNASKLEVRFLESKNKIVTNTTAGGYVTHNIDNTNDPNGFKAGKTYLCVVKLTPIEGSADHVVMNAGFVEFTGYPLTIPEITYQATDSNFNVTGHTVFSTVTFYPRGIGHRVDHMFVGETWADVQDPQPYEPPVYGPLIGYWPMDQGSGQVAPDLSGYDNDAFANGDVTWTYGQVAAGADFSGRFFNIPSIPQMANANSLSIVTWVKSKGLGGYDGVVTTRATADPSGSGQNWGIAIDSDHFEGRISGAAMDVTDKIEVDHWYHVALVYDGDAKQASMYIDGQKVFGPTTFNGVVPIISSGSWQIGNDVCCGGRVPNAVIDEVSIWNSALTAAQISDLYADGLAGIGTDGTTPSLPVELPPQNWIDPVSFTNPDVIFSKLPGLGNGGFEDLFDFEDDHPDYASQDPNQPFRIFCEGFLGDGDGDVDPSTNPNGNWCAIDNGGWVATVVNQGFTGNPAGWETPKYNPGYPTRQYEGESHFLVQDNQEVDLESNYAVDASSLEVGQNLSVDWYSYLEGSGAVEITPYLIFDKGTPDEYVVNVGTFTESDSVYMKRGLDWMVDETAAAASTLDLKFNIRSIRAQIRLDNVQVTRSPIFVIHEDPDSNVAVVPIKLLADPKQDVTLNVSTWSDEEAYVKYSTTSNRWPLMDDVTVNELTFTSGAGGNWNQEQNLVITSMGNDDVDGDRMLTFSLADPNDQLDPVMTPSLAYFRVLVIDDEKPTVTFTGADNLIVGEKGVAPGSSAVITVALGGKSTSSVQVSLVDSSDPAQVQISESTLVFTPAEIAAGTAKEVTITAVDDNTAETLEHFTSVNLVASPVPGDESADTAYINAMPDTSLSVTIKDADCGSVGHVKTILDVTGDCFVNLEDFAQLAIRWMECYQPNGDGCIAVH